MARKIPDKTKRLIQRLYKQDYEIKEIARKVNVSYSTAYIYTRVRERINPETKQLFESGNEYRGYLAKHRINPKTKQLFESMSEYNEYLTKQRQKNLKNRKLSNLIKRRLTTIRENQNWLAEKIGATRQVVSLYAQGKILPSESVFERLCSVLELPYKNLDDLLR